MSLSVSGAPGVSVARRSRLRDARTARSDRQRLETAPRTGGRLGELAETLEAIKAATGLDAGALGGRLAAPLDPSSPVRLVDVLAAGRGDLVTAYLCGRLDAAAVLAGWRRADA